MARPERTLNPTAGPIEQLAHELRRLRQTAGNPTYRQMTASAHYSHSTLAEAARGRTLPSWEVTRAFVLACGGDEEVWNARWRSAGQALNEAADGHGPARALVDDGDLPTTEFSSDDAIRHGGRRLGAVPRKTRRWIIGVAIVLTLGAMSSVVGILLMSRPAHSVFLGIADIGGYCRAVGYSGASADGTTAYDWHCVRPDGSKDNLSVIEACRWQYQRPAASARYDDFHNPNSWQCWDQIVVLGRVDLNKYCKALGYLKAVLTGSTVDTWTCTSSSGAEAPIDPDSACRWQYGSRLVVANVAHFRAPWEHWDCWG
jgi:hypothetical protein